MYISVSFEMPFHCASKTITSEISMSGEGNKGQKIWRPPGIGQSNLPGTGNLTKKFSWGQGFDRFMKRTCQADQAGENSSFIFTVCVKSVPRYHFKLAYVILQMDFKEFFETDF